MPYTAVASASGSISFHTGGMGMGEDMVAAGTYLVACVCLYSWGLGAPSPACTI